MDVINSITPVYFWGTILAIVASVIGSLGVLYKKKDDDDHISKGEFAYICLRGFLAGIVAIQLGTLSGLESKYSLLLAICAGLMRGKFLEDLANFANDIFASIFNAVKLAIVSGLATPKEPVKEQVITAPVEPKKAMPLISLPEGTQYYSQLNPKWKNRLLPNATDPSITVGNYGCLTAVISTLFQVDINKLLDENSDCWQPDGNMLTDKLLGRLNSSMTRIDIEEGSEIPKYDKPVICRTSWYSDKKRSGLNIAFATHFYILLPDGRIIDPARTYPEPNPVNKYSTTTNQVRLVTNTKI